MAEEYLENPRRAPRVRALCVAAISTGVGAPLRAATEDVGPHGCQLVSPQPFAKGTALQVELSSQETRQVLRASGSVAWCSPQAPWRLGLAFTMESWPAATHFFDRLLAARPGLASWRRVPNKLSLDAMVWLAPPPTRVVDFTAEELLLLRAVGSGATIYELRTRLKERWPSGQRSFFSLLSSGAITLSRSGSAPYQRWLDLLDRLEADLAPARAPARFPPDARRAPPPAPPPQARPQSPAPPAARPAPQPVETRNDGSGGLDREFDLEALAPEGTGAAPLELDRPAPADPVGDGTPPEVAGDDALEDLRDWPVEPAPPGPPPAPPPAKPRGKA